MPVFQHPHIPVETGAGVPAGIGVAEQTAHQHLIIPGDQKVSDVGLEGGIAVFPPEGLLPVDEHRGVHVGALKIKAAPPAGGPAEFLPVPAGTVLIQFLYMPDLPVVGQGYRLPGQGLGGQGFAAGGVGVEIPAVIPECFGSHCQSSFPVNHDIPALHVFYIVCPAEATKILRKCLSPFALFRVTL